MCKKEDKILRNCLFYTSCLQHGGTERMVCVYTDYFQKKGCQAYVLTNFRLQKEYKLADGVQRFVIGEKIQETSSRIRNYISRIRAIRTICKEQKIETAIVFARANAVRFLLATIGLKIRIIVSIRISPEIEFPGGIGSALVKKLLQRADGYLFQTIEQRDFFGKRIAKKSIVLPNAIEESFLKGKFPGERDDRIVTIGRLAFQKNQKMLIQAFSELADEFPFSKLVIYGEGDLRDDLYEECERLHIEKRVEMPGEVEHIADIIWGAGLFVLPSNYEGMPNALLEAMALGIPVISTDCPCGGPAELIQNGKNGILIPVGGKKELVEAMRKLLSDAEYSRRLGEAAREVQNVCSKEKTSEKLYEYVCKIEKR